MNSKIWILSHVELDVDTEEIHFLAHAATELMQRWDNPNLPQRVRADLKRVRLATNHLQELSMKLRAMEVAP